jgi:expansin (peptidoglycan-binding protein)
MRIAPFLLSVLYVAYSWEAGIVITNTKAVLGVQPGGNLMVAWNNAGISGMPASDPAEYGFIGLRPRDDLTASPFVYTATEPGNPTEGWGITADGAQCFVNGAYNWNVVVAVSEIAGTNGGSSAISNVTCASQVQVIHGFQASAASQYVFEATVTLKNTGSSKINAVRYRRSVDWDIVPTRFNEFVSHFGTASAFTPTLECTSFNGFDYPSPLGGCSPLGNFQDLDPLGPADLGSTFSFNFGSLDAGASKVFKLFYGVAPSRSLAEIALASVNAEVASIARASGSTTPAYNFFLAFSGVGGTAQFPLKCALGPYNATGRVMFSLDDDATKLRSLGGLCQLGDFTTKLGLFTTAVLGPVEWNLVQSAGVSPCGVCLAVKSTTTGQSAFVKVVDRAGVNGVYLSNNTASSVYRVGGNFSDSLSWQTIPCTVLETKNVVYKLSRDSSQWWMNIQIVNQVHGISSVSVTSGSKTTAATWQNGGVYVPNSGAFPLNTPFTVNVKAITGQTVSFVITDWTSKGTYVDSGVQFSATTYCATPKA